MNREQRRRAAEELRRTRQEEAALLGAQSGGTAPDIDFHRMIRDFRQQCPAATASDPIDPCDPDGIVVCVRKRPIQQHELVSRELDCVTACNPFAIVHERKFKVDGITKCLESHQFEFDRVFDEEASTDDVYTAVATPLVPWVIEKEGRVTVFAYGQTGSGKTHTMTGLQRLLAHQIFDHIQHQCSESLEVSLSFFEIYGGRPYDLLNNRQRLETLEDARNEVQISGLTERAVTGPEAMLQCIELGNSLRTTHATAINRDSSRSHAVCAVFFRTVQSGGIHAKITLVDLAGSERAADSKSSIRQRRVEGAQINKSLLALKECIRAMGDPREAHIPFRASKLTLVLRDAFVSRCPSRTVMIACISPGITSADHSVNTLRYSDRLKDHPRIRSGAAEDGAGDCLDRSNRRHPNLGAARDSKSPEPRLAARRRSPSPSLGVDSGFAGSGHSAPLGVRAPGLVSASLDSEELADLDDESEDEHDLHDLEDRRPPVAASAWEEDRGKRDFSGLGADVAGRGGATSSAPGSRQSVARRGRQPTLSSKAGTPHRPDALGSRGSYVAAEAGPAATHEHAAPPPPAHPGVMHPDAGAGALPQPLSATPPPDGQGGRCGGRSPEVATSSRPSTEARSPRPREPQQPREPQSPEVAAPGGPREMQPGDLHQQDNRYLHNTLTSEVVQRRAAVDGAGVVDVGVQDLNDLAHMEALDDVRQWEDRILSQHMIAIQEDARLLTAESELLQQVQQGAAYDIDSYVSEVDKVVRRKMEVYTGFLQDLEVFKAQLRREECLSRSCQRNRSGAAFPETKGVAARGADAEGGLQTSPRVVRDIASAGDHAAQRTPRTPRSMGVAAGL